MGNLGTEFKVGLFTIIAGAIIAYMFFVLSPEYFVNDEYKRYYSIVRDAAGIVTKTHVKTNGVIVGKVVSISLQANQTRLDFEIKGTVKIPEGSSIAIKEKGLLGDVFLEIIRGDDTGQYIEDGGFLPPADDQVSLSALISVAGSIGKDIKEVTGILAKVLGGNEGERDIKQIVDDVKGLAENARLLIEENRAGVKEIVSDIQSTTNTLRNVLGGKEGDLNEIITNVRLATADLREFSVAIRDIVNDENKEKIDKIIAAFDHTMEDVEVTAKNIRLVADKIEKGEGTIGKLVNDDDTLTDLQAAINDVREVLSPATKLQLAVDYHGLVRKDETTQHYFNTYLRTRPDKFYLLGFTDHSETVVETQVETLNPQDVSDDNVGSVTKSRERIVENRAIRFNVQFGKRWHFAQLRFGLFESTGGIASDFFLLSDRIKLSLEAFNWSSTSTKRRTAHLKAYASILFFKHIYAVVGVDDITRLDPDTGNISNDPNYFLGAGLNFDDHDLKALFGTAAIAL